MRSDKVSRLPVAKDASRGVISLPPAKGDCGMWCVLEGEPAPTQVGAVEPLPVRYRTESEYAVCSALRRPGTSGWPARIMARWGLVGLEAPLQCRSS
jgi:hypothetical protein